MIPLPVIEKFERYEALKNSIREMEAEVKELAPELIKYVPQDSSVATNSGSFTLKSKTTWQYTLETQVAEEELKATKRREEQDGSAIAKPGTPYIEYRSK